MRLLGMIFASLTMLCLLCAPALAQGAPSAAQYQGGGSGSCSSNSSCVQSLGDGADDFSENAEQGTDAVNAAMEDAHSNASAVSGGASASEDASAPPASAASGGDADGDSRTGDGAPGAGTGRGLGSITKLPETGGASLAALGSGLLLATLGLVALRLAGR